MTAANSWKLALRLRRDFARRRLRPRTRLSGRRDGGRTRSARLDHRFTDRTLAREQIDDFFAGERFELEQAFSQDLEIGAFLAQNLCRLRIAGLDQLADLGVNRLRSCFRNILLARDLVAEENLVLILAIGNGAELVGQ